MNKYKIEFYKHNLGRKDREECVKVLKSIFLTTGEVVKEFEKNFAEYLQVKYTIGVSSCTDALFLCLKNLGIKEGDEVITTPMSFIATSNAILYCNARPVFVDVEKTTGNIDANLIEQAITPRTKAIIPVHLYGHMCDMKAIKKIADKYKLKVIEDAAHCIEGKRDGIRVGELSDFACFSFYATKTITCGEGGAITCNSKDAYEWFLRARSHGMSRNAVDRYVSKYQHYDMDFLGYKSNMTNIQASLLLHQLEIINKLLTRREEIAKMYNAGFANNPNITIPAVLSESRHARHLYTIRVNENIRDKFLEKMQDKGLGVAINYRPIHLMSYYRKHFGYKIGDFPIAEKIGSSTISVPFYPKLKNEEVNYVIKAINSIDI